MARAYKIYIVVDDNGTVVRAFTVKHECIAWLSNLPRLNGLRIVVCRDGGPVTDIVDRVEIFL